jgi:hypothetical protein
MVYFHCDTSPRRTISFYVLYCIGLGLEPKDIAKKYCRILLHIDNIKSHNSGLSPWKTRELGFTRLDQSLYSPDLAPSDMYFTTENEVTSAVIAILTNISNDTLSRVFNEWIE